MRIVRALSATVGVAALTLLTGCGTSLEPDVHPGTAALVAGDEISLDEVDDLTRGLCAWQRPEFEKRNEAWPLSHVRAIALDSLVTERLAREFAEERDLEVVGMNPLLENLERDIDGAGYTGEVAETVRAFNRGQIYQRQVVLAAGREALGVTEAQPSRDEEAIQRGVVLFESWRKDVELEVDPRFGKLDLEKGEYLAPESLSIATSDVAREISGKRPSPEFVKSLPPSQRCG